MNQLIHPALRDVKYTPHGYSARFKNLLFLLTEREEADGKRWLHASVSRRDCRMPAYEDLRALKRLCIGEHRTALQVFPPASQYINWAGKRGVEVLHLWCCLDGDVVPDFRIDGMI